MVKVWAPSANSVRLDAGGKLTQLSKSDRGWWNAPHDLPHGECYSFEIDEKRSTPDPRSPRQPRGVHGPSCYVDHSLFKWSDANWQQKPLSSAIIYELHIGTFTRRGTFEAAIERLDHLKALGVTHIEVMPIAAFQGDRGWGYDGVSLYAPHEAYGGPEGFKNFVNACHEHGLAVLLDVVYNHLGPSGNYLPQFGPYFSDRHTTPWGPALNFDGPDSDEVRRFFCDNAIMWLRDYHVDGLRLDAVHAIVDTSAIPFLEQLASEVNDLKAHLGRHLVLIAESDLNDPRVIRRPEMGGYGLDAQWSDDIHHSLHTVLTGEQSGYYKDFGSLEDVATSMQRPYVYAGRHSPFRRRSHGRPALGLNGHQFIAYLQNHDQLGNRARGERVCHLANIDRVKIGAALILTSPYVPMLFQGEEWAASSPFLYFVGFEEEPELARAVAEGRCREFSAFGWRPEEIPERTTAVFDADRSLLEVHRGPVAILCNFSTEVATLPNNFDGRILTVASKTGCRVEGNYVRLMPESVAILAPQMLSEKRNSVPQTVKRRKTPVETG